MLIVENCDPGNSPFRRTSCPCPICAAPSAGPCYRGYPGYVEGTCYDIYRCQQCDARFIASMEIEPALYEFIYAARCLAGYDRYVDYGTRVLYERDPLRFLALQEGAYHVLARHLAQKSNLRILDVGCGYGYLTHAMRSRGFEAFGIDISAQALTIARQRYGDYFFHADVQSFGWPAAQRFDLIVAIEVIEHLADPVACVRSLLGLLTPSGSVLITTPNSDFCSPTAVWRTELPPVHTVWLGSKSGAALAGSVGCDYRIELQADFYPHHENKLAKYLGYRKAPRPAPRMASDGTVAAQHQDSFYRVRGAANRLLHECGPVRAVCNLIHNRMLRVDETLAMFLWKRGQNPFPSSVPEAKAGHGEGAKH